MDERTTAIVQRYLDQLSGITGNTAAEPIVRQLLAGSLNRLQILCASMLFRSYPRLTRPPLNLEPQEMLSAVVERMLKAMRSVRPKTVRQFFSLANQHMRWELNDLARRLDKRLFAYEDCDSELVAPVESGDSQLSACALRMLQTIEGLPPNEREAFDLMRIQGMTYTDAAAVIGISVKTVRRRLNRALLLLSERLSDLKPSRSQPPSAVDDGSHKNNSQYFSDVR